MTTTWWWIRHAPVRDKAGILYGTMDVDADCSNTGLLENVGYVLPPGAQWLTSPLKRARQTQAALRQQTDADPQIIDAFKEQDFGTWQGRRYSEIEWSKQGDGNLATVRPPEGESFEDVQARVSSAIQDLSENMPEHVVVISHAGPIRAAIAEALGLNGAQALQFEITPLSLTRLTSFGKGQWRVDATNQILG